MPRGLLCNNFVEFVQLVMFMFLRNLLHMALCNSLTGVIPKSRATGQLLFLSSRPFVPLSVKDVVVIVTREREKIRGQRNEYFPQEKFICYVSFTEKFLPNIQMWKEICWQIYIILKSSSVSLGKWDKLN